jgi:proliferating cell nuclear antigen
MKDGNFDCSTNGIALQGVDPSFVALIQLTLKADGFEQFRVDHNTNLGVNLENMIKILKCAGPNDSLTLKAVDNDNKLTLLFENDEQDRISQFDLKLKEIDADSFSIPPTSYNCIVKMPSSEFQRICRELTAIGEDVEITVSKEGVKFAVEGSQGSGSITCKHTTATDDGDGKAVQIKLDEKMTQKFTLRYLNNFAKASSVSDGVTLMLNDEVPLVVEYRVGELGHLRFFLAPKAESEETAE